MPAQTGGGRARGVAVVGAIGAGCVGDGGGDGGEYIAAALPAAENKTARWTEKCARLDSSGAERWWARAAGPRWLGRSAMAIRERKRNAFPPSIAEQH